MKVSDHRIREKGDYIGEYQNTKAHIRDAQGELPELGRLQRNWNHSTASYNYLTKEARKRIRTNL